MASSTKNYVKYKDHFKEKSPQRAEHLKPFWWKPGESGNKEGRPTGSISIVEQLKAYLRRHPEAIEDIVVALVKEGKLGNLVATKEMLDRIDGKVVEKHQIEGELPVRIQFVPAQQVLSSNEHRLLEDNDGNLPGAHQDDYTGFFPEDE